MSGLDICEWSSLGYNGETPCGPASRWILTSSGVLAVCPSCWLSLFRNEAIVKDISGMLVSRDEAEVFEVHLG